MPNVYLGEFLGTMFLILFGDGVVANVVLSKSKGAVLSQASQWIVITAGWGFAVMVGIAVAFLGGSPYAFINPAVAIAFAVLGKVSWSLIPGIILSEIAGAFVGGLLVYVTYYDHFKETTDQVAKLAVFSTIPNIRHLPVNFVTEVIGTFALVLGVLALTSIHGLPTWSVPVIIAFLVWGIGLSLGGPTGYAINPARDLGPRLAHAVVLYKEPSDWTYGLTVPIWGPIVGGLIAVAIYLAIL